MEKTWRDKVYRGKIQDNIRVAKKFFVRKTHCPVGRDMGLRRLILDVLKPIRNPGIEELASALESLDGVEGVNITVKEVDVETMTLMIIIEGKDLDLGEIRGKLEDYGAVIHSIDQVVAGEKIIDIPSYYIETI